MNARQPILTIASLSFVLFASLSHAVEPGFIPLLDRDHTDGWEQCGPGKMEIKDGISTNSSPAKWGVAIYKKRIFADFVIKAEFKGVQREFNSGVWLRISEPNGDVIKAMESRYEVGIFQPTSERGKFTGSIWGVQPALFDAVRGSDWNEFEITVIGQRYLVKLNGQTVNDFTGNKNTSGYIGLESNAGGPVQFRNVRIKDLSVPVAPSFSATIQTDANQPRIEVIKDQGPNATEWALTPLDEAIPGDIRQNITYLREDLLDESKKSPKAPAAAYTLASDYCDKILNALDQRDLARVNAGFSAAQADAGVRVTSQALEARRNYMMSWPQYAREKDQRSEILRQQTTNADVKKERIKVEWGTRAVQMRSYLDDLYTKLRAAMR